MSDIKEYRRQLERDRGRQRQIQEDVELIKKEIKKKQKDLINTEQAQLILQKVAKDTQQELEYHISELTSTALVSVFNDPYSFHLEFIENNGKTEALMRFERAEKLFDPMGDSGGGVVDLAALTLRVSLKRLKKNQSRGIIILDEPAKFVSRDIVPNVAKFISLISHKLGIQFIIVTHIPEFIEEADKVFRVTKNRRKVSIVEVEE